MSGSRFIDSRYSGLPDDFLLLDLQKQPDRGCAKIYAKLTEDDQLKEELNQRIAEIEKEKPDENLDNI